MSFWGKSSAAAKANAPKIRIEKVAVQTNSIATKRLPTCPQSEAQPGPSRNRFRAKEISNKSSSRSSDETRLKPRNNRNNRRRSPVYQRIQSDSSDDDAESDGPLSKKQRIGGRDSEDLDRKLRSRRPFSQITSDLLIHAADIASKKLGFRPPFDCTDADDPTIYLQYPGGALPERYELVFRNDSFDPVEEIIGVVKDFTDYFLESELADPFLKADNGIIRRIERARNLKSLDGFKKALQDYNSAMQSMREEGVLAKALDQKHSLPERLVIRIMTQTYDRAVSPKVDLLRKYENGTNEIYGELKSNLVYKILAEAGLTSDQVFVDLGSGVANVVLQAALQIGCESWGCEIMENACALAEAQKVEFEARCRLWGFAPGSAKLERGDFMTNENIRDALKRADVVLVNNEVFTPDLNISLVNLFLDLKEGCKIFSLKSFVPQNRKISTYNANDPSNVLRVEKKTYSTKSVSWKDEGGDYYVATKDSKRLQALGDDH